MTEFHRLDVLCGRITGMERPFLYHMSEAELIVRYYEKGEGECSHIHDETTEIIVVVEGSIRFGMRVLKKGDVVLIDPDEKHGFRALKKTSLMIFKAPCVPGDERQSDDTDLKQRKSPRKQNPASREQTRLSR